MLTYANEKHIKIVYPEKLKSEIDLVSTNAVLSQ